MRLPDITSEQKTLLNIGKICGWIESSSFGDNFRHSVAKLTFELTKANLPDNPEYRQPVVGLFGVRFLSRFINLYLNAPHASSCSEKLQTAHRLLFSHRDGFRSHPGEWVEPHKAAQIDEYIDGLSDTTSPFTAAFKLHEFILKSHPFSDGNQRIAALAPNYYLQTLGIIPYPIFIFRRSIPEADADQWFAEQTEKMVQILQGINRLKKTYADRTNGLATQRKKLLTKLLPHMMRRPKFGIQEILDDYGEGTLQTISQLAKEIKEPPINILEETTGFSRFRIFHLHEYTKLFSELI